MTIVDEITLDSAQDEQAALELIRNYKPLTEDAVCIDSKWSCD